MELRNPDGEPTLKQLAYLKTLTGNDYRDAGLTKQEASDMISELEVPGGVVKSQAQTTNTLVIPKGQTPFNEPQVTLITGEQRSGKNNTAVGRVVDSYDNDCVRIYCLNVLKIVCEVKGYDRNSRVAKVKYNGKRGFIRIPEDYKLESPMKIFANFHLYGIPFVYCPSFNFIIDGLNTGLISDGWLLMDEYYIGAYNRESMKALPRALAKRANQYAKMMLRVIILAPLANQLPWETRLSPTEQITTEFNKKTCEITCRIKKKGVPGTKTVTYNAMRYWKHYWTNETVNN